MGCRAFAGAAEVAEHAQFDLARPLGGDAELRGDLAEGVLAPSREAVAELEDLSVAGGEGGELLLERLLLVLPDGRLLGIDGLGVRQHLRQGALPGGGSRRVEGNRLAGQ